MNNNIKREYKKIEISNRIEQYKEFLKNCSNDKIYKEIEMRLEVLEELQRKNVIKISDTTETAYNSR